jgi:hypothetical protein
VVRPLIVAFACLVCVPARAADRRVAELDATACAGVPYDRASLSELLRVELGPLGVERVILSGSERGGLRCSITPPGCDPGTTELLLVVADADGSRERRMPLADVPVAHRSRALAIAFAELVRELDAPLAPPTPPAPPAPPAPAAPPTPTVPAAVAPAPLPHVLEPPAPRPWLGFGSVFRTFPSEDVAALGVEASLTLPIARELRLSFGADGQLGSAGPAYERTRVGAVTAWIGTSWTFGETPVLELGPALHVGYGWADDLVALSDDPRSDHAVFLGTLAGTLHVGLAREFHGHVGLEMGVGLLDTSLFGGDERANAGELGAVLELGARLGIDYEL